ncbi:hypothetical protein DXG03_005145 [Asterophora parasitica]|uniref:Uncharacterized protein n=1 Tax=Asterophora parasitica TaxID=117018 RepID=A0A9P7K7M9_9AGAR|nr:hypothetical protein DXG03_005145 [Asterophora parasitica]
MLRKDVPDLDLPESPLISANPFGSTLGVVPGSALAERIFNDPRSWGGSDDDNDDELLASKDAITWLADEMAKYSGEELALSPVDRDVDIMLKPFAERFKRVATSGPNKSTRWEGVLQDDNEHFPPLFEHTSLDLSLNFDLRLSKIWDSGGKMFHESFPSQWSPSKDRSPTKRSIPLSATNNVQLVAALPALDLAVDGRLSPMVSPVAVASASTTWSILEWYGVHPGTPRMSSLFGQTRFPPTPIKANPPASQTPTSSLRTPSCRSANVTGVVSPPPLPPQKATHPARESTPFRRLPIVPGGTRNSPSPMPTPEATPPRKSTERTARVSATLYRPSTSASDASYLPPNVTPVRSGSLTARSPPMGPRPRSGSTAVTLVKQRQGSGRDSPSPFTIAPAPAPARARKPTSPPPPCLGVWT